MSPAARRDEIRLAAMMLTRLPVGRIADAPPLARAAWAFPLVGVAPGLAAWAAFAAVGGVAGAWAACLAGILVTGGLHHDGLADYADGIWGGADRARALEIMRDSRIGSYGTLALIGAVGTSAAAIGQAGPGLAAFLFAGVASRLAMLVAMVGMAPARADGLGRMAAGAGGVWPGLVLAGALGAGVGLPALAMAGAGALVAALLARVATARIGGQTGDVLGAVQLGSEVAAWIALAAVAS